MFESPAASVPGHLAVTASTAIQYHGETRLSVAYRRSAPASNTPAVRSSNGHSLSPRLQPPRTTISRYSPLRKPQLEKHSESTSWPRAPRSRDNRRSLDDFASRISRSEERPRYTNVSQSRRSVYLEDRPPDLTRCSCKLRDIGATLRLGPNVRTKFVL